MKLKPVKLALQGGGAHGAFTWGVLDRLLEEPDFAVEAISGASAGAMNAACLAGGLLAGGREGARAALDRFWHAVAIPDAPLSDWFGYFRREGDLPGFSATMVRLSQSFSPYHLNPFNVNPLRAVLESAVDVASLQRPECPRLYIAATRVEDGGLRVFGNRELDVSVFLASACLPNLHHAVEIDGVDYWDGGYSANPPMTPLVFEGRERSILLVMLEPERESAAPRSRDGIRRRTAALNFSVPLQTELRVLQDMRAAVLRDRLPAGRLNKRLRRLRVELIEDRAYLGQLHGDSRLNTQMDFLRSLKGAGREAAGRWLVAQRSDRQDSIALAV